MIPLNIPETICKKATRTKFINLCDQNQVNEGSALRRIHLLGF
jgi:hypothetical protein